MVYVSCSEATYSSLQNLLEPTSVAGFSSVSPVIMVSVGPSKEQRISPSYKMVNNLIPLQKAQLGKIPLYHLYHRHHWYYLVLFFPFLCSL